MQPDDIREIVDKHRADRGGLISTMEEIQEKYSYLPAAALQIVAEETGKSPLDIYGVATFYKSFTLKQRGKHLCSVCMGTACHVRGAKNVVQEFQQQLDILPGDTTKDNEFTLETVNCLGACALGPVTVVDGHYFSSVKPRRVTEIISKTQAGLDKDEISEHMRHYLYDVSCSRCNHTLMDPDFLIDGSPSIRVTAYASQNHGPMRLSALYGSFAVECEFDPRRDTIVDFFCPHCHTEMKGISTCPLCRAPMVNMIVRAGGILQICSRRGCKGHMLDINGNGI